MNLWRECWNLFYWACFCWRDVVYQGRRKLEAFWGWEGSEWQCCLYLLPLCRLRASYSFTRKKHLYVPSSRSCELTTEVFWKVERGGQWLCSPMFAKCQRTSWVRVGVWGSRKRIFFQLLQSHQELSKLSLCPTTWYLINTVWIVYYKNNQSDRSVPFFNRVLSVVLVYVLQEVFSLKFV